MSIHSINRRKFIKQAGCAAMGSTTLLSTLLNLKSLGAASIFNSAVSGGNDYKALVCILLSGGADAFNMLVPKDQNEYNIYAQTRSNMALDRNALRDIQVLNTSGRSFGVHPAMLYMQDLFNSGDLAFVSNIGTLIRPVNKQEIYSNSAPLPLGLFSHSDQVMHWQTAVPQDRVATGWGGKIADMLRDVNENQQLSINLSLAGTNLFQVGQRTVEYTLDREYGSIGILRNQDWVGDLQNTAVNSMLDKTYADPFKQSYKETIRIARDGQQQIQSALESLSPFQTSFSTTDLSQSMHMIAKMIASREVLDMKRQIFFVDFGGWDTHDELLMTQEDLLLQLDNAIHEFYSVIKDELGLADQVTLFNISEFSRTLTSNGNGTDHAWGSNVFVLGGAVNGQRMYGDYPLLSLGNSNPLEIGGGILIPTTSADSYFAELALWFGVPESDLSLIFPNLNEFYSPGSGNPLGFLNI